MKGTLLHEIQYATYFYSLKIRQLGSNYTLYHMLKTCTAQIE